MSSITPVKPHIVYRDGVFSLFRSRWKSKWPTARAVCGLSVTEIQRRLAHEPDRRRFRFGNVSREEQQSFADTVHYSQTPYR